MTPASYGPNVRTCPACAAPNPDTTKFCGECGGRLPVKTVDEEQRKTVTVLFSDVTGSTALGEQLEPETLRRMLARFFEIARDVVESHGGTVEKFIGDAVMAVFGVPTVHEDDALRALRAARDLMAGLKTLNADLEREYGATVQIRIGVNTGDVVTGTSERLATGDAVNVAARLEQLAPPGEIYVGAVTAQLAGASAQLDELEPAMLKGKSAPTRLFRLVDTYEVARPPRSTPLVGRKRQLEMLRGTFSQAVADRSCVLFTLLGAAGVGKSRLVAEFLTGLDAVILRGRCLSYGKGIGLWPAAEIVHQAQEGPAATAVAELLADDDAVANAIRALLDGDVAVTTSDLALAIRRLVERIASKQPVVVILDDLHWGEAPLFELVEHLVTLSRDAPILMLAMGRPELLERRENWGGGALNATTVLLEPLDPGETAELVDVLSSSLDPAARAKVRDAAAGNPLFAEEMVALVEASEGAKVQVPPTIQALLAARLDQLAPAELRALERGSIEGQSFHRGALAALDPDDTDLPQRLLGLVRKDLLRPDKPTLVRDEAYRFRHLLFRDAAYDRLPKSVRAELHERFARWLDGHASDIAERDHLVGYHLEQAYLYRAGLGPVDDDVRRLAREAASRLSAAGRRQMARSDLGGAIDLLDRANALAPPEKPDVSLELGIAASLQLCGRPVDALERAAAAALAAAEAGDVLGEMQARLGHAALATNTGHVQVSDLQRLVQENLPALEAAGDDGALSWGWWSAVQVAHSACRFDDGLEAGMKSLHHARRSGDPFLMTHMSLISAHTVLGPTPAPDALEMLDELRTQTTSYDPWVDSMQVSLLALMGRIEEARDLQGKVLEEFRERGQELSIAIAGQSAWEVEMAAGNVEGAAAVGFQSCAALESMGERGWMSTNASQLAESLCQLGRDAEAAEWAERALELGDIDDAVTQAQARMVRALLAARRGDIESAGRDAEDALRITAAMQAPYLQGQTALNAASVYSALGDNETARTQLHLAIAFFSAKGATVHLARAEEALRALSVPT